jgi:hypothetical protein
MIVLAPHRTEHRGVYRLASGLVVALLLAGCAAEHSAECDIGLWNDDCAPGSRAYEQKQAADAKAAADQATQAAQDDAQCRSQGLQPDTPPYVRCLDSLANQRAQADTQDRAGVAGRLQGKVPF